MKSYPTINRQRLTQLMRERGIGSIQELSRRAGIHRNTLYPLFSGERSPFAASFVALCRALGTDPLELVTESCEDLDAPIYEIAANAFRTFEAKAPGLALFLFGSRSTGKAKRFSDYDIGLTGGEERLDTEVYLRIRQHISELADNLPVKVDVVNFDAAPPSFLSDFDSPLVFLAGNQQSLLYLRGVIDGVKKAA